MSNVNNIVLPPEEKKTSKVNKNITPTDVIGIIPQRIGTGDNAKNSIIYLTIKWAFISGCVISGLVVANYWFFREKEKVPDFTNDIEIIWEVIIPIITLSLGYAFGKSQK
jgi:hypothetical protein